MDGYRFGFNGQEKDDEVFGATGTSYTAEFWQYDSRTGRRWNIDPVDKPWMSGYHAFSNKPITNIDPNGANDSPIYDSATGDLLGTDDQGIDGDAIIMDKANFTQGMKHEDAMKFDKGMGKGFATAEARKKMVGIQSTLALRPDYDGIVTIDEGVAWAKQRPGIMQAGTATTLDALYLDASKLNFGTLYEDKFESENVNRPTNLFIYADWLSESSRNTTYALGRVDMILTDRKTRTVIVLNNEATVYDWNLGGDWKRETLIREERLRHGLDDSHGFPIMVYGQGTLNEKPAPSPTPGVRWVGW